MIKSTENTVKVFPNMNSESSLAFKIKIIHLGAYAWNYEYKMH